MLKGLIAYFSLGGTTAKVASSIAEGLRAHAFQVDLYNIQGRQPPDIRNYDLLGIGSPVYVFRLPFNVQDYVRSLPHLNHMPAFSFNLYGTYPFDAGQQLRHRLAKRGAWDLGYFSCRGTEYFLGYLQKGYLFSPDNPTSNDLKQAEAFGHEIFQRMKGKAYTPAETFPSTSLAYRLERLFTPRWFVNLSTRFFKVDSKLCNNCHLCVKVCPNANIKLDGKGRPKWGRDCLACYTCQMKCPQDAITSALNSTGSLLDYNTRHASSDKALEFVKVRHQKGRTERL